MPSNKLAATALQLISLGTSTSFFVFYFPPASVRGWAIVLACALLLEFFFVMVKESAWKPGLPPKIIAFIFGYGPDALVNTGGLMAFGATVLTYRPLTAILNFAEVDLSNPNETLLIVVGISLLFGFALSIGPHVLWRDWGKRAAARA